MAEQREHIVMLPLMAQGHVIPFLALARNIQQHTDFSISICSTPLNIHYLRSALNSSNNSDLNNSNNIINLIELPFNSIDHGLPPNTENTDVVPLTQLIKLFHSTTSLENPLRDFISKFISQHGRPPLCIISDVFLGWAVDVAESFGIIPVTFSTGGAYGTAAYVSIWQNLPHTETDSDEFNAPGFPDSCFFHKTQLHKFVREADGADEWSKFFQPQISHSMRSSGWICNTAKEIEPSGLELLQNYIKLPVWCLGPLLPPKMLKDDISSNGFSFEQRTGKVPGISPEKCIEWLDSHAEHSVLFISFGSQNTITATQMMELALGLEASGKPFIWAIRPPFGFDIKGEFKPEWLPEGFEERVTATGKGLLVHKWAPQLEILCHRSTGAFLSHCGWNSVMESLSRGVPIIGWPLAAEQSYNSKMLEEEMGVCVELTRTLEGNLEAEQAKCVIQLVLGKSGKGMDMKRKAVLVGKQIREAVRVTNDGDKGSSLKAMDSFVEFIMSKRKEM
ncbi:UDP-glucuronosyl/UDP-glucosyltransferase [Dillenia turbinata]|uniref:Glycosyltransferase n=1 Tax=Dillenia turbinata TaxID=194707 RepID=A0AAN8ZJR8_9MAGN